MPGVGRAATLVGDDRDLVALGAEPEHRAHEVVPDRPEEPGGAHDPGHRLRPPPRRAAWCARRRRAGSARRTRGTARAWRRRRRSRSRSRRAARRARRRSAFRPRSIAAAPCGSSSAPSTFVHAAACRTSSTSRSLELWQREADVPAAACERERVGELLGQRVPELAARARDQDAAAESRSERSGDRVLQRSTTRGSFQGIPFSSGSAASYSSVTR